MCFEIEEGYGETDPYVSTLFDEIWHVEDEEDCCSRVSFKFKSEKDDIHMRDKRWTAWRAKGLKSLARQYLLPFK